MFLTFVLILIIHYLASAKRRSLSLILRIYLDFSFRLSPVAQRIFSYIYKNIAIVFWYGFFATLPLVITLSLIIHLSFGNLFCSIWIMITNNISENLGLTQSDLVDYSQLVGKILI